MKIFISPVEWKKISSHFGEIQISFLFFDLIPNLK